MKKLVVFLFLCLFALVSAQTHRVEAGETLYRIAQRYGLTLNEIIALNNLSDPDRIEIGQTLMVSQVPLEPPVLVAPFAEVRLAPETAVQGRTQTLRLTLSSPATVQGRFLGRPVTLTQTPNGAEGLVAVAVLDEPGVYTLELTATLADGSSRSVTVPVRVAAGAYRRESLTLTAASNTLTDDTQRTQERQTVERACATVEAAPRWQGRFRYPVENPVHTSVFGTLRSYNGGPFRSFHGGLDLRGNESTPIFAPADGVVLVSEDLYTRGGSVILGHGLNVCSLYNHLSRMDVTVGQTVSAGDLLGYAGSTGLVTGPHLHWEVRVGGVPVDPLQWVQDGVLP